MRWLWVGIMAMALGIGEPEEWATLRPELGFTPDVSAEALKQFLSDQQAAIQLYDQLYSDPSTLSEKDLTAAQNELLSEFNEINVERSFYEVGPGMECSWYCGGGPQGFSASSQLVGDSVQQYIPHNAHDFDISTAWVEGVEGPGIG